MWQGRNSQAPKPTGSTPKHFSQVESVFKSRVRASPALLHHCRDSRVCTAGTTKLSEIPLVSVTRRSEGSPQTSLSKQDAFLQAKAYTNPSYSGLSKPFLPCFSLLRAVQRPEHRNSSHLAPRSQRGHSRLLQLLPHPVLQRHLVISPPSGSGILQGGELPVEVLTRVCGATELGVHSSAFPCTPGHRAWAEHPRLSISE